MKNIMLVFTLLFLCANTLLYAQMKAGIGVDVDMVMPIGKLNDTKDIGYEVGAIGRIALDKEYMMLIVGISYLYLPGKEEVTSNGDIMITHTYAVFNPIKVSLGAFIGKNIGLYILPTLCGSIDDEYAYMGIDLKTGYLLPIWDDKLNLDFFGKFGSLDLIREGEKGKHKNVISFGIGITL